MTRRCGVRRAIGFMRSSPRTGGEAEYSSPAMPRISNPPLSARACARAFAMSEILSGSLTGFSRAIRRRAPRHLWRGTNRACPANSLPGSRRSVTLSASAILSQPRSAMSAFSRKVAVVPHLHAPGDCPAPSERSAGIPAPSGAWHAISAALDQNRGRAAPSRHRHRKPGGGLCWTRATPPELTADARASLTRIGMRLIRVRFCPRGRSSRSRRRRRRRWRCGSLVRPAWLPGPRSSDRTIMSSA